MTAARIFDITFGNLVRFAQNAAFRKEEHGPVSWGFVGTLLLVLCYGLIMLFSASYVTAYYRFDDIYYYIAPQAIVALIGIAAMFLISNINYHALRHVFWHLYILLLALLVLALYSEPQNNCHRWVYLFGTSLQPSEIAKFAVVLGIALFSDKHYQQRKSLWYGLLLPLLPVVPILVLLRMEPHNSAILLICAIAGTMLLCGGCGLRWMPLAAATGLGGLYFMLTAEGNDFIPIAERMLTLWKETKLLQHSRDRLRLSVGCADSVNVALLTPFYRQLLRQEPALDLHIHTRQSSALYDLLDARDMDVAFVFYHLYYKNILCQLVYQEKLYLVQSQHPAVAKAVVHTEELDAGKELFFKWDDRYQIWHNQWLTNYGRPAATTDTITMLDQLWDSEDYWVIAPESVICTLSRRRPVFVSQLKNPPPNRRCYKITHRAPLAPSAKALEVFEKRLGEYLEELHFPIRLGEVWQEE